MGQATKREGWRAPASERLNERMKKINDQKRDSLLTFEQLGVDDLTADEAHEFKTCATSPT